jgi:hypothetical protein
LIGAGLQATLTVRNRPIAIQSNLFAPEQYLNGYIRKRMGAVMLGTWNPTSAETRATR